MSMNFWAPMSAPKPASVQTASTSLRATRSASTDELPWAMLANGPACTKAGPPSSVWSRLGLMASRMSTVIAPATLRSSSVTGRSSRVRATTMRPNRARRSWMSVARARMAMTSEATLICHSVSRGTPSSADAEADDRVAQGAVADVDDVRPGDGVRLDAQRVAVMQVVVEERRGQVVGRADGVVVAGQVEVEVLHRHDLAVAAAGRAALDAEDRPERRLADGDRRAHADAVEALGEADGRGRLALAERRRRDGRDEDLVAVGSVGQAAQDVEADLGLVRPVELELLGQQAELGADVGDRAHRGGLGDLEAAGHRHRVGGSL